MLGLVSAKVKLYNTPAEKVFPAFTSRTNVPVLWIHWLVLPKTVRLPELDESSTGWDALLTVCDPSNPEMLIFVPAAMVTLALNVTDIVFAAPGYGVL